LQLVEFVMQSVARKRIEVEVEARHVPHIRSCLAGIAHADFTVAPILSGFGLRGYWSSERAFQSIGDKVCVRFTADAERVQPLIASGFGIVGRHILLIKSVAVGDDVQPHA
jgi:hypothetical protein